MSLNEALPVARLCIFFLDNVLLVVRSYCAFAHSHTIQ